MKTRITYCIGYIFLFLIISSFKEPKIKKRISDTDFRYEFYTTNKKVNPSNSKIYFYFKGGIIHQAQAGAAGELLNDSYLKLYHSNQLAEKGNFKKGLKVGKWNTWFENGKLETIQRWKNGLETGEYLRFNNQGKLIEKGRYVSGLKHGIWINYIKKDTVVYRNNSVYIAKVKKPNTKKQKKEKTENKNESFFTKIFGKKTPKKNKNDKSS